VCSDEHVAVKIEDLKAEGGAQQQQEEEEQVNVLAELTVLQSLTHPRLVRFRGAGLLRKSAVEAKVSPHVSVLFLLLPSPSVRPCVHLTPLSLSYTHLQVMILMEVCENGALRERLFDSELSWSLRARLALDVALGLQALHAHHLVHR
jgi:serine/threonine protein kinase